MLDLNKQHGLT